MGEPLRFRQVALAPAQRFFRSLALGDIGHRTHEFKIARFIVGCRTTDNSNVLTRAGWHQQPMFKIKGVPVLRCLIKSFLEESPVLRMGSLQYTVHGRFEGWVVFKDSKRFL